MDREAIEVAFMTLTAFNQDGPETVDIQELVARAGHEVGFQRALVGMFALTHYFADYLARERGRTMAEEIQVAAADFATKLGWS